MESKYFKGIIFVVNPQNLEISKNFLPRNNYIGYTVCLPASDKCLPASDTCPPASDKCPPASDICPPASD